VPLTADAPSSDEENPPRLIAVAGAWQQIKDHKVIQWGVAYFAAALALAHAEELVGHAFHWPPIAGQILIVLLVIGFFVAIVLAWYHGHKGLTSFSKAEMSILAALLIVGAGMLYVFVQPAEHAATETAAHQEPGARPAAAKPGAISLAVLPFVNLSSDKEQEFFSDGMTEEITSALAKVSGLNVVSRTSAFEFKGTNRNLRSIAQTLGASHLIEGSVRKAGNKVRITAQLIRADDDTHLWTQSYDRELKDVFAVQEEIATAIAGALRVPLGLKAGQSLVANRTADTESYQDYLRARALVRGRGTAFERPLTDAANLLEQVVARDPNYAPAWGMLAYAYALTPTFTAAAGNGSTDELRPIAADSLKKAEAAAEQAIRLDPNNADAYIALGYVRSRRGRHVEAEDLFKQALSLDAGNPEALNAHGLLLASSGKLREAIPLCRRLQAQEPLVPIYNRTTALVFWANGRNDEAIAILKALPPTQGRPQRADVYASVGRYNDAAETLRGIRSSIYRPGVVDEAVRLLRAAPAKATSPQTMLSKSRLGFVYLYVGAPDRALDHAEGLADAGIYGGSISSISLWAPSRAPVRKTARFKVLVRKIGLVDYWRARGWPEFCRPTTGNDFVCH